MGKVWFTRILIVLACIVFILINLFFVGLSQKTSLTIDLTEKKFYVISDVTQNILENLDETITVTVFASESTYPIMAKEILKTYEKASSNIMLRYISPYENPLLIESFLQRGVTIKENDIVVEGSSRYKHLELLDLFEMSFDNTQIVAVKAEQTISSALLYVTSTMLPKVYFTKGHNERVSESLYAIFSENNYEVSDITLTVSDIQNADVLVIAGPTKDFERAEIDKISLFLEQGGSVLVFLEPSIERHKNLEEFLLEWQISVDRGIVLDNTVFIGGNYSYLVPVYAPHEINVTFTENEYFLTVPQSTSFSIHRRGTEIRTNPLLLSSSYAYRKDDVTYGTQNKEDEDVQGQYILAVTSEKDVISKGNLATGKLITFGSKGMYGDDIMGIETYGNSLFLSEVASYATKNYETISIPSKSMTVPPLALTENAAYSIVFIILFVIPICVFLIGLKVYLKRKNL